jgi:transposase
MERKFNLIHEHEWTCNTVTGICKKYGVSRKTYYKWKNRYDNNGIDDLSRVPGTIKYKVDTATEETILDLRLKRFGCNRIRFRLTRLGVYLSSRTIYKILKRHCLNILKCRINNQKYRRFAMKHPNDMVQMDILGPFYSKNASRRGTQKAKVAAAKEMLVIIWHMLSQVSYLMSSYHLLNILSRYSDIAVFCSSI